MKLLENVTARIRGTVSKNTRDAKDYLKVERLMVEIDAKRVGMAVKNVYKNNRILGTSC